MCMYSWIDNEGNVQCCLHPLKLAVHKSNPPLDFWQRGASFVNTPVVRHMREVHGICTERYQGIIDLRFRTAHQAATLNYHKTALRTNIGVHGPEFYATLKHRMMNWYLFTHKKKPSQSTFDCPKFRDMFLLLNKDVKFLSCHDREFQDMAELQLKFMKYGYKHMKDSMSGLHKGNKFVQGANDGGTASNGHKYMACGEQFVYKGAQHCKNIIACIGFKCMADGCKALQVMKACEESVAAWGAVLADTWDDKISDGAVLSEATLMGFIKTICDMHNDDKILWYVLSLKVRTRNKVPIDPCMARS